MSVFQPALWNDAREFRQALAAFLAGLETDRPFTPPRLPAAWPRLSGAPLVNVALAQSSAMFEATEIASLEAINHQAVGLTLRAWYAEARVVEGMGRLVWPWLGQRALMDGDDLGLDAPATSFSEFGCRACAAFFLRVAALRAPNRERDLVATYQVLADTLQRDLGSATPADLILTDILASRLMEYYVVCARTAAQESQRTTWLSRWRPNRLTSAEFAKRVLTACQAVLPLSPITRLRLCLASNPPLVPRPGSWQGWETLATWPRAVGMQRYLIQDIVAQVTPLRGAPQHAVMGRLGEWLTHLAAAIRQLDPHQDSLAYATGLSFLLWFYVILGRALGDIQALIAVLPSDAAETHANYDALAHVWTLIDEGYSRLSDPQQTWGRPVLAVANFLADYERKAQADAVLTPGAWQAWRPAWELLSQRVGAPVTYTTTAE